jgi:endonuclease YncB( thermonuclease family)
VSRLARLVIGVALLAAASAVTASPASAAVCADYANQAAAQQAADTRDADHDGIYCEALPCPCSSAAGGSDDAARRQAAAERKRQAAARRRAATRRRAAEHQERVARQRVERGHWRVSGVLDGDTVEVRRTDGSATEVVDLVGVDAPEGAPDAECGGADATALIFGLTFPAAGGTGALVRLETDRTQDVRDDDAHLLAYVEVTGDIPPLGDPAGYDLGEQLVAAGFSAASVDGPRFARYGAYHEAERRASAAGSGAWSACGGEFHRVGA